MSLVEVPGTSSMLNNEIKQVIGYFKHVDKRRTSDGGNGNHSVSLPIILIKIKVD